MNSDIDSVAKLIVDDVLQLSLQQLGSKSDVNTTEQQHFFSI